MLITSKTIVKLNKLNILFFFSVSVHKKARKYTRFILDGVVYEYLGQADTQ